MIYRWLQVLAFLGTYGHWLFFALALRLCRLHRGRVLAAVHELLEPFGVEPGDKVVAMGDHGHSDPTAEGPPLSQRFNVRRDV